LVVAVSSGCCNKVLLILLRLVEVVAVPGARLTVQEREEIAVGQAEGLCPATIARRIGRDRSTVTRELKRNGRFENRQGRWIGRPYRATKAHEKAARRARRPKPRRLEVDDRLRLPVVVLLGAGWSPQQISAMLPGLFPDDESMRVSHETIYLGVYQGLFVQGRGELRKTLARLLRTGKTTRKPLGRKEKHARIVGMVNIRERPAEAEDRAVFGHWEGDLIMGAPGQGAVITLVERSSRFVMLAPLPGRHTAEIVAAELAGMITELPAQLWSSLTWDQGHEMARHAEFTVRTGVPVYFCDPYSPWQRGSNENTNGLLRQYWPKGSDMRGITQADCDRVAWLLNTRPRKTLDWHNPAWTLNNALVATAD
jgi:IS30 family transposase